MQRVAFNTDLILRDMAEQGLNAADLARRTDPEVAKSSVTRFLNGEHQTARMAKLISKALGRSVRRYLPPAGQEVHS